MAVLASLRRLAKLAREHVASSRESSQRRLDGLSRKRPPLRGVGRDKRHVGSRKPPEQGFERVIAWLQKQVRQADGQARPHPFAIAAGILRSDPPHLAGDADRHRTPLLLQAPEPPLRDAARGCFVLAEIAEPDQQVMSFVRVAREPFG